MMRTELGYRQGMFVDLFRRYNILTWAPTVQNSRPPFTHVRAFEKQLLVAVLMSTIGGMVRLLP